jgi:hypothetical protein
MTERISLLRGRGAHEHGHAAGKPLGVRPHFFRAKRVSECCTELNDARVGSKPEPSGEVAPREVELGQQHAAVTGPDAGDGERAR